MASTSSEPLTTSVQQLIHPRNEHHQVIPVNNKPEISIIMHPHPQPITQQLSPNEALFKSYDALIQELSEIGRDIKFHESGESGIKVERAQERDNAK